MDEKLLNIEVCEKVKVSSPDFHKPSSMQVTLADFVGQNWGQFVVMKLLYKLYRFGGYFHEQNKSNMNLGIVLYQIYSIFNGIFCGLFYCEKLA